MKAKKKTPAKVRKTIYSRTAPHNRIVALVIIGVVIILGTSLMFASHAATPVANIEAEKGTVTSPATTVADNTASGGSAVKFGSADVTKCSRSALFVPTCGALWGFYDSGNIDVTPRETQMGRQFDMVRRYYSLAIGTKWPMADDTTLANSGHILHVDLSTKSFGGTPPSTVNGQAVPQPDWVITGSVAPGTYYSYDQITSGQLDPLLTAVADHLKTLPYTIMMDFLAEGMDTVNGAAVANDSSLNRDTLNAEYKAAYQHVWQVFHNEGVTNVVWVYTVGGSQSDSAYTESYPGDSYVSWIMWDPYNNSMSNWRTPLTVFSSFYNRLSNGLLGTGAESKPWGLGEYGSIPSTTTNSRPVWMSQIPSALQQLPKIKSVEYFNSGSWGLFTDSSDADSAASIQAFATAGQDPYVNQEQ